MAIEYLRQPADPAARAILIVGQREQIHIALALDRTWQMGEKFRFIVDVKGEHHRNARASGPFVWREIPPRRYAVDDCRHVLIRPIPGARPCIRMFRLCRGKG